MTQLNSLDAAASRLTTALAAIEEAVSRQENAEAESLALKREIEGLKRRIEDLERQRNDLSKALETERGRAKVLRSAQNQVADRLDNIQASIEAVLAEA